MTYDLISKIGGGSFGMVYKAVNNLNGELVAIKIINLEESSDDIDDIQKEIYVLSNCHCPQLTKYISSQVHGHSLWIVMEYLSGGSVHDLMQPGPLEEIYIAIIIKELLEGLVYLHSQKKIHRDIKAANILISGKGDVKLADFGVTAQLTNSVTKRSTFIGTPYWMAPEVITESRYDESADIWSVGITAIEMAKSSPPHAGMHPMRVLFIIPKQTPPKLEGNFSKGFKDFVSDCLQFDPSSRPSAKTLLKHKFVRGTRKTSSLVALIERRSNYLSTLEISKKKSSFDIEKEKREIRGEKEINLEEKSPYEFVWDFNTIKDNKKLPIISNNNNNNALEENNNEDNYKRVMEKNASSPSAEVPSRISRHLSKSREERDDILFSTEAKLTLPIFDESLSSSHIDNIVRRSIDTSSSSGVARIKKKNKNKNDKRSLIISPLNAHYSSPYATTDSSRSQDTVKSKASMRIVTPASTESEEYYESDASLDDGELVRRNPTLAFQSSLMTVIFPSITQTLKSYKNTNSVDVPNIRDALMNLQASFSIVEQVLPNGALTNNLLAHLFQITKTSPNKLHNQLYNHPEIMIAEASISNPKPIANLIPPSSSPVPPSSSASSLSKEENVSSPKLPRKSRIWLKQWSPREGMKAETEK